MIKVPTSSHAASQSVIFVILINVFTTIIFDYAGVITRGDPGLLWYNETVSDYKERKSFFDELGSRVDTGGISKGQFIQEISNVTDIPADEVWRGIKDKTKINIEVVELISKLKEKYTIGLLSNYVHEWLMEILEENNLNKYFDAVIISSIERAVKPKSEIFKIALDRLEANAKETLFIDDRQENLTGAKALGIKGLLFTSAQQLENDLTVLSI